MGICLSGGTGLYCGTGVAGSAWYETNSEKAIHVVGRKRPNAWGLYDMSGNVWEWVADCYYRYDPKYDDNPLIISSGTCSNRVLRGGSWNSIPQNVRAAFRGSNFAASVRNVFVGFRLARTLP